MLNFGSELLLCCNEIKPVEYGKIISQGLTKQEVKKMKVSAFESELLAELKELSQ